MKLVEEELNDMDDFGSDWWIYVIKKSSGLYKEVLFLLWICSTVNNSGVNYHFLTTNGALSVLTSFITAFTN